MANQTYTALRTVSRGDTSRGDMQQRDQQARSRRTAGKNIANTERVVSLAAGSILTAFGLARGTRSGLLAAGIGSAMIHRGVTGRCQAYRALGINTRASRSSEAEIERRGVQVQRSFQINRSPDELYQYWRVLENLPHIMTHLEAVRVIDERRSHWVAKAPTIAGGRIEWDAEITIDEPGSAIGWRSLPGSSVDSVGEIRFTPALGDRGTEVQVSMSYVPPAGKLGHWVATLFGSSAEEQIREDLRNFKRIMETGEIPTTVGQSRGTCSGQGKRSTE